MRQVWLNGRDDLVKDVSVEVDYRDAYASIIVGFMGVIAVTSKKVVENVELMHPGILSAGRARMVVVAV